MYKFNLIKNYYLEGNLYKKDYVEIKEGLTILVGCNGSGKTTMISQMKDQLKKDKTAGILEFNNLTQGGSNKVSELAFHERFDEMSLRLLSSEGENIYYNIGDILRKIGRAIHKKETDKLFIFLDAVDSGLSIDYCSELIEVLKEVVIPDAEKSEVELYIIASTNAYELARQNECLDVQNCTYRTFRGYEYYRKFILRSRKNKDKRVNKNNKERR
jgi:energy-coupling factor transporter ATP-binding protein EcfA2